MDPDPSKTLLYFFPILLSTAPGDFSDLILPFLILIGLLISSAIISGSEVAFFSLEPQDFHTLEKEDSPQAKRILELRETPRTLLATILIVNNIINILIVFASDAIVRIATPDILIFSWGESIHQVFSLSFMSPHLWSGLIEFFLTVVLATFLLVLFGEITPKIYASINNLKMSKSVSWILVQLHWLFLPVSRLLVHSSGFIERRFNTVSASNSGTSKDEIDKAIDLTLIHEYNAESEKNMLKSIVKFGDVTTKQIMRARVDMVALEATSDFSEVMDTIRSSGYSRIPVYEDDLDHIIGILYVKDLLGHFNASPDFDWLSLLRKNIMYVPEAKKINEVLKDFRKERVHMALVVDEYGGTSGLVTLEDILEEVIGEIKDEFDDDNEISFEKIDDYTYIFDGKTMINDMCKVLDEDKELFDEVRGDADSIAGLFLEMYGQMPKVNTEIRYSKFVFSIVAVNKRRIEKIKITIGS